MASSEVETTVWHAFYDVLREYGLTTMFGNPGSTEQPMLQNFPKDFNYILCLQEASSVAMADGYAQATRKPGVVSLHTSAGTGNAMASIMTAALNKTPLVLIAGQQHRDMLIGDPLLTNRGETDITKPWTKWAYQPVTAKDVPAALVRAIATAVLPPQGPVYLSIPLDDWDQKVPQRNVPLPRAVSTRFAPDPEQLSTFAGLIRQAKKPALVLGPEVDKSLGWAAAVKLAETLGSPVFQSPGAERAVFPETHPLFQGQLPPARGPISDILTGHDIVLVIGAEVWRYYPYIDGPVVPSGTRLLHITNDPHDASTALTGDAILSDARLALEALVKEIEAARITAKHTYATQTRDPVLPSGKSPITALDAFTAAAKLRGNALLVQETPSNAPDLIRAWPSVEPESYFTFASGGLWWNAPAAVGIALAQQHLGTGRPTVLAIGDGSLNYSVQSIYSAVQHRVKLIYLVPRNEEYAILKEFAILEQTPNVPGLDLPGLDAVAVAKAYGCPAFFAKDAQEIERCFKEALNVEGPVLIEFPIDKELRPLVAQHSGHPK